MKPRLHMLILRPENDPIYVGSIIRPIDQVIIDSKGLRWFPVDYEVVWIDEVTRLPIGISYDLWLEVSA